MILEKFASLTGRIRRMRFERAIKRIADSPNVTLSSGSRVTLVSMVNHRDAFAYLLAVKTFARSIGLRRAVVVADPTLDRDDQALIARHVEGVEFRDAVAMRSQGLPSGGCWERLVAIAHEVKHGYVIQLDADTVTMGPLLEVVDAVEANRSFLLASEAGLKVSDLGAAVDWARIQAPTNRHIQIQAESNLDVLDASRWRYVRACAGFAGFPTDSFRVETLQEVTDAMVSRLGARWQEWGTEQVTSNLVCASQPRALLLPNPKYCNADLERPETEFLHFIGYARFTSSRYEDLTRAACRMLAAS